MYLCLSRQCVNQRKYVNIHVDEDSMTRISDFNTLTINIKTCTSNRYAVLVHQD